MSGPKVVVTTETARKLCERDLRRLENESSLWLKRARKLGEFNEADYHETLARRDHLRELLRSERFLEVRKIADAEIAYLKNDLIEREIRSIERAASKRERQRRQKENTGILLKTLATKTLPPELEKKLRFLAQGEHLPDSEKILAQGFALLADTTPPSEALNDDRHQLASRLQTGISRVSLTEWLSSQAAGHRDERLKRIDRHIAELQSLEGEPVAQPFLTRLAKAEREDNPAQRNLLLDSLVLDLAQTTRKRRELRERTGELQSIAIELAASPNADKALLARVETELAAPDPARVHSLMEECRTALLKLAEEERSQNIRQAMLSGLSGLGYEVREGMETMWAENGKLILSNTARPGYGVEILGKNAKRVQLRPVALTSNHDKSRDRDIETLFCGEVNGLQAHMAQQGLELSIVQARAVGEVPVKVIGSDEQREAMRPFARTM